jgi:geranylgeranyl diphosphate synthase type II
MNLQSTDVDPGLLAIPRRVEQRLSELVPGEDVRPVALHRAIRYSLLAPGKRIRPTVTILSAAALGGSADLALDPACAVEMVHTASLILDDLPAMDDAATRRGRPACHREFGEDIATLASVALLNRSFGVLAEAPGLDAERRAALVGLQSRMIGGNGIVAGQLRDLHHGATRKRDAGHLERIAREKTGALFVNGAEAGAIVAGASGAPLAAVREFAVQLGLCFQVLDDLVDHHGCSVRAGKDVGQDADKVTFVALLGVDGARGRAESHLDRAIGALAPLGPAATPLELLGRYMMSRAEAALARS